MDVSLKVKLNIFLVGCLENLFEMMTFLIKNCSFYGETGRKDLKKSGFGQVYIIGLN